MEDKMTLSLKAKLWSFSDVNNALRRLQVLLSLKATKHIERDEHKEHHDLQDVLDNVHGVDDVGTLEAHADLVPSPLSRNCLRVGLSVPNILRQVWVFPVQRLLNYGPIKPFNLPRHPWDLKQHFLDENYGGCLEKEDEGQILHEQGEGGLGTALGNMEGEKSLGSTWSKFA